MMTQITANQLAYDFLESIHVMWDRKNENHIWIGTNGYKTHDCHEIERKLLRYGFFVVEQNFDQLCGKTITVYKHKKE